jgi:hypothetical protein
LVLHGLSGCLVASFKVGRDLPFALQGSFIKGETGLCDCYRLKGDVATSPPVSSVGEWETRAFRVGQLYFPFELRNPRTFIFFFFLHLQQTTYSLQPPLYHQQFSPSLKQLYDNKKQARQSKKRHGINFCTSSS